MKFQLYHAFKKLHGKTKYLTQLMDRGRVEGAYLLLKRFKARLKLFDKALEKLYFDKVS